MSINVSRTDKEYIVNVTAQLKQILAEISAHNDNATAHKTLISEIALKADQAMTYNKTEIDDLLKALPTLDLSGQIGTHNTNSASHEDIRATILSEIIRATTAESTKVDKIEGKSLSTNDFTNALLTNLNNQSGINTGDETQAAIISKLGATPANYDLSNLTSTALSYLKTICSAIPTSNSTIGQWKLINESNRTLPAGGSWAYFITGFNGSGQVQAVSPDSRYAGIAAGGTSIGISTSYTFGLAWRIA